MATLPAMPLASFLISTSPFRMLVLLSLFVSACSRSHCVFAALALLSLSLSSPLAPRLGIATVRCANIFVQTYLRWSVQFLHSESIEQMAHKQKHLSDS
jgi:hypothetical protein